MENVIRIEEWQFRCCDRKDKSQRMIKLAFFDVDGTLSAPQYMVNGKLQIGMSEEAWHVYCKEYGENIYAYCKPIKAVKDYARKRKREGAKLYVLTTCSSEEEVLSKRKFVEKYYTDMFEDVISVEHDAEKVEVIKAMAKQYEVELSECELVEDTLNILFETVCEGIVSTHVANIFADLTDGE